MFGVGAWLSLVERPLWERNVAGSNPVAPTILRSRAVPSVSYGWQANPWFTRALRPERALCRQRIY